LGGRAARQRGCEAGRVSARALPVLAPGDEIRLGGQTYQVVALDGSSARLAGVTGAAAVMLIRHLLADPSFELVTSHRRLPPAVSGLEHLPDELRATSQWWEQHLVEVLTGLPPDALPGTAPQPEYDPRRCSLRQRELAKHAALTAAGHEVALSTLQRLRRRYELEGIWGLGTRAGTTGSPAARSPRAHSTMIGERRISASSPGRGRERDRSHPIEVEPRSQNCSRTRFTETGQSGGEMVSRSQRLPAGVQA